MREREMALVSAINRTGAVTSAADALGMSQPAASAMLKQLESRLGYRIFSRERRKLVLTANGRALLPEMTNALAALDSVDRLAESMRSGGQRRLVIGSVAAVSATLLPPVVEELHRAHPGLRVVLRTGMALEIVTMAVEQRIALGIILGSGEHAHLGVRHLANPRLCGVMEPRHRLAKRKRLTIDDVAAERYIAHARHLPIGALTAQLLEAAGHAFAPSIEVMQFTAACAFAEAGAGIALVDSLTGLYARRYGLAVVPVDAPSNLAFHLIWPLSAGLSGTAKELADLLGRKVGKVMGDKD